MSKTIETINYPDGGKGVFERQNGRSHGLSKITYPNGQPEWFREMYKGRKHGYSRRWNKAGLLIEEEYYWRNKLINTSRKWFDNGVLQEEREWEMNCLLNEKIFDKQGRLIEEKTYGPRLGYQDIQDRVDLTHDYKTIRKYEKFDPDLDPRAESILEEFKKGTYLAGAIDPNTSIEGSFIGDVRICKEGEEWPRGQSGYQAPIVQLRIQDLPEVPKILEDLSYLMIFLDPEGYAPGADEIEMCIRAYGPKDVLIPLQKPAGVLLNPRTMTFESAVDYTDGDLPEGLCEYLQDKYPNEDESPYECHNGTKVLGWPWWKQWSELPADSEFIMQIDEYGQPYWDWGDCPNLYIFRNITTGEFQGIVQMA